MVLGCTVDTGSRYDSLPGTAHLMQHMAFKSSEGRSALAMVRECEKIGAVVAATAARENMVYQVDTLKESVPAAMELLADTILEPKMLSWEVEDAKNDEEEKENEKENIWKKKNKNNKKRKNNNQI